MSRDDHDRAAGSDADLTFPRLVYKGAADDTAQTQRVEDRAAFDACKKDGWRLQRGGPNAPPVDTSGQIDIPAQRIKTGVNADPAAVRTATHASQPAPRRPNQADTPDQGLPAPAHNALGPRSPVSAPAEDAAAAKAAATKPAAAKRK